MGLPGTHGRNIMRQGLNWLDPGIFGTGGLKVTENLFEFFCPKNRIDILWTLNIKHASQRQMARRHPSIKKMDRALMSDPVRR